MWRLLVLIWYCNPRNPILVLPVVVLVRAERQKPTPPPTQGIFWLSCVAVRLCRRLGSWGICRGVLGCGGWVAWSQKKIGVGSGGCGGSWGVVLAGSRA